MLRGLAPRTRGEEAGSSGAALRATYAGLAEADAVLPPRARWPRAGLWGQRGASDPSGGSGDGGGGALALEPGQSGSAVWVARAAVAGAERLRAGAPPAGSRPCLSCPQPAAPAHPSPPAL